jgi:transposase
MPARNGSIHVATTSRTYKGKTYQTHLLRRTFREGDKVKHQTLGNISHLPEPLIDLIRRSLKGEQFLAASDRFEIRRSLPHGHVQAVLGCLRRLDLEDIIASQPSRCRRLVTALIVQRILDPGSKLATARELSSETAASTLGQELQVDHLSEDDLYAAMDWALERQSQIETKLAGKHLHDGSLILYDVSSSYYTGQCCPLAHYGHDRDGSTGYPIIVYGLLCNSEGCPVAIEVFAGNTADPKTLSTQIQKIRQRFKMKRVVLVGDRGLLTQARIEEECRSADGLDWISALRAPQIAQLVEAGAVDLSLFDERDLAEIQSPDYPQERLIVCRNPLLAQERARKRHELLAATEKLLEKIQAATRRVKRPLKGKDRIGLRVGKVINRYKMGKHFIIEIEDQRFAYHRDQAKIDKEAALDGIYIIRTSVPQDQLQDHAVVRAYKDLSQVEQAFRSLKTVDLKVRPIYHRLEHRVRAHVFLCMLAYYVEWHMRRALAPILFEEDAPEQAAKLRKSIVAPAQRSEHAEAKAQRKRTEDDLPVHSFSTLLKDLATLVRNWIRPKQAQSGAAEFAMESQPTPLQRRAFQLLTQAV